MKGLISGQILIFLMLLVSCGSADTPPANQSPQPPSVAGNTGNASLVGPGSFRSDKYFLSVELPSGWAGVEGPITVARPFEGQVAFNSWGQKDFWAKGINEYSLRTTASQVPDGGAYVVLIRVWGPAPTIPDNIPDGYTAQDLRGLWQTHDARRDMGKVIEFYKWGRPLMLEVYCSPNASDETVSQLNTLLMSWQFDEIPAGDAEWAERQARQLLPESAGPTWFPVRPGYSSHDNVARITEVEVEDKAVHFRFIYSWGGAILSNTAPSDYRFEQAHWWTIDVLPNGRATLSGEGGATLPK